jgi:hypothetical protein
VLQPGQIGAPIFLLRWVTSASSVVSGIVPILSMFPAALGLIRVIGTQVHEKKKSKGAAPVSDSDRSMTPARNASLSKSDDLVLIRKVKRCL